MRLPVCFLIYEPGAGEIKRQVPCDLKVGSKEWTEPSGMLYSFTATSLIHKAQENLSWIFHFPISTLTRL